MSERFGDLLPTPRILLGAGPTMADPRVLRAMATPLLGQFDPEFTAIMNEVMALTRFAFRTANGHAFPVSGSGRAGMEAAIVSLVQPGERVIVGECGRFGRLLIELAERCGAEVVAVPGEWGRVIEPERIAAALAGGRTRLVAMVHGETSTGVLQPLAEIARLAHEHDALLYADAVVTLGGCAVDVDAWGIDVASASAQQLPRSRPARRVLEPRALQSPHGADGHGVRAARGATRRPRGRARGALRPPSPARRRASRRAHRAGPEPVRQGDGRAPPAVHHAGARAGRCGRAARAAAARRGLRHRDRRGVRSAAGQDLAHRHDGLRRGAHQRSAVPGRARARPRGEGFTCAGGAGVDAAIAHYASAGARPERVADSLGATGIGRL